jgi:SAM-dependent methyltransferase
MTTAADTPAAFWDQRYAGREFAFGTAPNVFLAAQKARLAPGMRALVPGDGEGRNGVWLAEQGLVVQSVDASPLGVEKARRLAAERGVAIDAIATDLTTWTWPVGSFDVVASIYVHWRPDVRERMHASMLAALKPGGLLILEAYTPHQLAHRAAGSVGGPPDPAMLYTAELLRADFSNAEIISLEEVETVLAEGHRHTGPSSIVRLLARRRS